MWQFDKKRKVLIYMLCMALFTGTITGCKTDEKRGSSSVSAPTVSDNEMVSGEDSFSSDLLSGELTPSQQSGRPSENGNKTSSKVSGATTSASSNNPQNTSNTVAELKTNSYNSKDVFVVTVDASKAPYNADKTGKADATSAIQKAVNQCQTTYGGGIVFLPKGTYKISNTLNIKSHVILKGEYQSPDKANGDYGTVISVNTTKSAFTVNGSAGVSGITTYYPSQSISKPIACDYTFNVPKGTGSVIENVTMLNSYKGIGVCTDKTSAHGLITLDNIHGTVLNQGIYISYAAEVGVVNNIYLSPAYWAKATSKYQAPSESSIRTYMTGNSSSGLYLAGTKGIQYSNLLLDNFKTGIETGPTPRSDGAEVYGQFYNLTVQKAVTGANLTHLYTDMGLLFANSSITGSSSSVKNASSQVVKLFNSTTNGSVSGNVVVSTANIVLPSIGLEPSLPTKKTLYNVVKQYNADNSGETDCSAAIQKALDAAKSSGGGYVYLPGGTYRLDKPITVYANTLICGANATLGCDTSSSNFAGTSVFCYYGKGKSASDTALITLAGNNAGCSGIRFYYPQNGITKENGTYRKTVDSYSYTIRGTAANAYCENLNFYATYAGIEMKNASNYIIKRCVGSFYSNGIHITSCNGGYIDGCLSNSGQQIISSYLYLTDFENWIEGSDLRPHLIEPIGRQMNNYIIYDNSQKQTILNTFAYIPHSFLTANNSTVSGINLYASRMGAENSMFILSGGKLLSVNNYLKDTQLAVLKNSANVGIYNIKCQIHPSGFSEENLVK